MQFSRLCDYGNQHSFLNVHSSVKSTVDDTGDTEVDTSKSPPTIVHVVIDLRNHRASRSEIVSERVDAPRKRRKTSALVVIQHPVTLPRKEGRKEGSEEGKSRSSRREALRAAHCWSAGSGPRTMNRISIVDVVGTDVGVVVVVAAVFDTLLVFPPPPLPARHPLRFSRIHSEIRIGDSRDKRIVASYLIETLFLHSFRPPRSYTFPCAREFPG